ncbi:MAG: 50S ribosomal protein L9 [Fusobacteriaceae bacterium]
MSKLQVILTQDVAGQGRKGEIVNVSEGYARNFLLKGNKAIIATPDELKKIENKKKKEVQKLQDEKNKALELKAFIESKVLKIIGKVGENGKLFGAITNKEVSSEIEKNLNLDIDRKKIECNIKSTGEHTVILKLHSEVKADLKVFVSAK